jgi:hypothetical protein
VKKQFKLPKEFAIKWLAELRSGKYKQTRNILKCGDAYCCLGIAGKICGVDDNYLENNGVFSEFKKKIFNRLIPLELLSKGTDLLEKPLNGLLPCLLTALNDGRISKNNPEGKRYSFSKIADWIEENVEFYD